jgi:hypothetical protein
LIVFQVELSYDHSAFAYLTQPTTSIEDKSVIGTLYVATTVHDAAHFRETVFHEVYKLSRVADAVVVE